MGAKIYKTREEALEAERARKRAWYHRHMQQDGAREKWRETNNNTYKRMMERRKVQQAAAH